MCVRRHSNLFHEFIIHEKKVSNAFEAAEEIIKLTNGEGITGGQVHGR
jgi:hypothetical protein